MKNKTVRFKVKIAAALTAVLLAGMTGAACGSSGDTADSSAAQNSMNKEEDTDTDTGGIAENDADTGEVIQREEEKAGETEIQVFIAASLQNVMTELAENYNSLHPEVKITYHADSSGTLLIQMLEGYECDIFFSAAQKQMDQLEAEGLTVDGTRTDAVRNRVIVIARKDSNTKVTGLSDLGKAESIALAGGSVPVGRYTRQAFVNMGVLRETGDAAEITASEISKALGGVEISEQDNVSKVLLAVAEGSCEAGTVYCTDLYGYEDELEILETVDYELTGEVIYPVSQVVNPLADEVQTKAAEEFLAYILSDEAKPVFEEYYYDTE